MESPNFGGLVPSAEIVLLDAESLKVEAAKEGAKQPYPGLNSERVYLAYVGVGRDVPSRDVDRREGLTLADGSLVYVKSLRHKELEELYAQGRALWVAWPIDRVPRDFVIAASVRTNTPTSSSVFVWGAMTGEDVDTAIQSLRHWPPKAGRKNASANVHIPLSAFSGALYQELRTV